MKRFFIMLFVLASLSIAQVNTAKADAFVSFAETDCNSFTASGTSDAPYVMLRMTQDVPAFGQSYYAIFPVNQDGTFTATLHFPEQLEGMPLWFHVYGVINEQGFKDFGAHYDASGSCYKPVESGFEGPAAPSNFVLRTIICDVAVYNTPGGVSVGDNAIHSGQTWFVNPNFVVVANGDAWTEIFVSGYNNGFIPTSCIQQ
jgi:hypothetical protein